MPGAGGLDRRIVLLRLVPGAQNAYGEDIEVWGQLARPWAKKLPQTVEERTRASEVGAVVATRFLVRWSSELADLNARDRAQIGGLVHTIVGVEETERLRWLEIRCLARAENRT